ncbi:MAG TPA: hypothetical protein VGM23_15090 [Armatimonadota bacterium]
MRMVSDALIAMESDPANYKPDECLFIVDKAIEFADEYLATDAHDERIKKLRSNFSEFCHDRPPTETRPGGTLDRMASVNMGDLILSA